MIDAAASSEELLAPVAVLPAARLEDVCARLLDEAEELLSAVTLETALICEEEELGSDTVEALLTTALEATEEALEAEETDEELSTITGAELLTARLEAEDAGPSDAAAELIGAELLTARLETEDAGPSDAAAELTELCASLLSEDVAALEVSLGLLELDMSLLIAEEITVDVLPVSVVNVPSSDASTITSP